jgi:hypothetical protein
MMSAVRYVSYFAYFSAFVDILFCFVIIFVIIIVYFCYLFWGYFCYFLTAKDYFFSDKISEFWQFLRFNHIPGHHWFYFLHILQEFIHICKQKTTVEVVIDLVNTFHDIGKMLDLGRRMQNPVRNCMPDLCKYNIYGINFSVWRFYMFYSLKSLNVRSISPPRTDVITVGLCDPCMV